jgi:hypothetical protein
MVVTYTLCHVFLGIPKVALVFFNVFWQSMLKLGKMSDKHHFGLNYGHFEMGITFFSRKTRTRYLMIPYPLPYILTRHWKGYGILYGF